MDLFHALAIGVVQGITEFLPISSSGHLLLYRAWTGFSSANDLAFDASLHLGTLVAVLWYFWKDLLRIGRAWVRSFFHWEFQEDVDQRLAWLIGAATLPAGVVGLTLGDSIESAFRSPVVVGSTLILGGVGLLLAERYGSRKGTLARLCLSCALVIGMFQVFALIPGVSRSGATIIAGLLVGLKRPDATRFAFYLSVPIVLLAGVFSLVNIARIELSASDAWVLGSGIATSALAGYLAIRWLLGYVSRASLSRFAWYRFVLGAVVLAWVLF